MGNKAFRESGLVVRSDKAADWCALSDLHKEWSKRIIKIEQMTREEEMESMSVNHPYFSLKEMEARERTLEILHEVVAALKAMWGRAPEKNKGGRPRLHVDNAAKQKSYRARNGDVPASKDA